MTRIDFYLIKDPGRGDRFAFTCKLVERIRANGLRVLIHCPETDRARHLDRLLWTFREDSFIPHGLVGETNPVLTPVLISADGEPQEEDQVLINLGAEIPEFFSRFERLCEPLDTDPDVQHAGRKRYAYYRNHGYPLAHHEI